MPMNYLCRHIDSSISHTASCRDLWCFSSQDANNSQELEDQIFLDNVILLLAGINAAAALPDSFCKM